MFRQLFLFAVVAGFAAIFLRLIFLFDVNKRVYNHAPGPCRQLEGIKNGAEDITLVEELGIAFLSSGVVWIHERPGVDGEIFLFDFHKPLEKPVSLEIKGVPEPKQFHPHGLTHWVLSEQKIRLFVISHTAPSFEHSVIVLDYDVSKNTLSYVKTIKDSNFIRPNGIIAAGPDSFVLTNDGSAQTHLGNVLEILFMLKAGSVVYYDGKESHWLLEKEISPNGVALDRERKHLFIAHVNEETIGVYNISADLKELKLIRKIPLLTCPDNLYVDRSGALWTAAHPVVKDVAEHLNDFNDLTKKAPSQVLKLVFNDDFSSVEITEPFTDDGRRISASATAIPFGNYLLIGSVCREALLCEVSHPATL